MIKNEITYIKYFILVLACAVFSSCVTSLKVQKKEELNAITENQAGVIFPLAFISEGELIGNDGCELYIRESGRGKELHFTVRHEQDYIFAELKPGRYYFEELNCGRHNWTLMDNPKPAFQVQAGKISVASPIKIFISDNIALSFNWLNRVQESDMLTALWGFLNENSKSRLVSGYTPKQIDYSMIQNHKNIGLRESISGNGKVEKLKNDDFSFRPCYRSEELINHLWLGRLELSAKVKDSQITEIEEVGPNNTFTPHFVECAKTQLKLFKGIGKASAVHVVL